VKVFDQQISLKTVFCKIDARMMALKDQQAEAIEADKPIVALAKIEAAWELAILKWELADLVCDVNADSTELLGRVDVEDEE
jgi:hypothetical protein